MKARRIVVATDFSESSLAAVEAAFELARSNDASVYLVFVREPPLSNGSAGLPLLEEGMEADGEARLGNLIPEGMWSRTEMFVLEGQPAREIASFAARAGADLIVVGTHGRRGLSRVLLGSTAETLVRQAPCAVLVAKGDARVASSPDVRLAAASTA